MDQAQYDRIENGLSRAVAGIGDVLRAGRKRDIDLDDEEARALRAARRHLSAAFDLIDKYDPAT